MTAALVSQNDRLVRQADLVPALELEHKVVTVIGCGAVGRQVAIQLAAIGVKKIILIDFDQVTETNVTTQGFLAEDVGDEKVMVVKKYLERIEPTIEVEAIVDRFRPKHPVSSIVFVCVDSIGARAAIWAALKGNVELLLDGRMLGEVMRVLAVRDGNDVIHYEKTLFPQAEQEAGRCTAQGTIYCAMVCAGLMMHQLARHLRSIPTDVDTCFSMLAGEMLPVLDP